MEGEPIMDTATWRLDFEDGSGPMLLIEVDRDGDIWLKQGGEYVIMNRAASLFLRDALPQAILIADKKAASLSTARTGG